MRTKRISVLFLVAALGLAAAPAWAQTVRMGGARIQNVGTPTASDDAATMAYVLAHAGAGGAGGTTGTGATVLANGPTMTAAAIGAASAASINKVALTPVATGATITLTDGVTLTAPASVDTSTLAPKASPTFTGTITVPNGSFANAALVSMANGALKCRKTSGTGAPEDCTASDVLTILGFTAAGTSMAQAANAVAQAALWGVQLPTVGTNIPDANTTVSVSGGSSYTMPTATAARTITLGTSGSPLTNEAIRVSVTRTSAFAVTIQDDASTPLIVVPASVKGTVVANYSGTHFAAPVFVRTQ